MIFEAIPLIASPTVISSILSPEVRETTRNHTPSSLSTAITTAATNTHTALEEYLARSLGLTLIAFSILNLLLTGSVPLVVCPPLCPPSIIDRKTKKTKLTTLRKVHLLHNRDCETSVHRPKRPNSALRRAVALRNADIPHSGWVLLLHAMGRGVFDGVCIGHDGEFDVGDGGRVGVVVWECEWGDCKEDGCG